MRNISFEHIKAKSLHSIFCTVLEFNTRKNTAPTMRTSVPLGGYSVEYKVSPVGFCQTCDLFWCGKSKYCALDISGGSKISLLELN